MTIDSNSPSFSAEEIFARAVERLEAGEPLEAIIAAYPAELHTELRDLLTVSAATHSLQTAEIPRPSPSRRAANKRAFLQAAAAMRAEVEAEAPAPAITQAVTTPPRTAAPPQPALTAPRAKPAVAAPTWLEQWRIRWSELWGNGAFTPMQFAPLAVILAVVSLATFSFSSVAQAAIPGDLAYPAKQWLRQQELSLAAPEDQPGIVHRIEVETAEDLAKAIVRAVEQKKPIRAEQTLFFRGWEEGNLRIGSLLVEPNYQVNPPDPATLPMAMEATPVENRLVNVIYQIVPDENGNIPENPRIVQGISLTVIEESIVVPTVTPTACLASRPAGWVPTMIKVGDTISAIAKRTGTDPAAIIRANCIPNADQILVGEMLFAPALPTAPPSPTPMPSLEATLTAVSTTVSTEVITPTATLEPEATATLSTTVGITPTMPITPATTITPTVAAPVTTLTPTVTITATVVPTVTLTPTMPVAGTPEPTAALSLTLTAIAITPEATTIVTTTVTPEPAATPTPPAATAEPSVEPTLTTVDGTPDSSDSATPTALVTPDAIATTEVDSSAGDETTELTPVATGAMVEATAAEPPATVAPTAEPVATEAPPTSAPEGRSGGEGDRATTPTPTPINGSPLDADD